jgi:hypothetical protein
VGVVSCGSRLGQFQCQFSQIKKTANSNSAERQLVIDCPKDGNDYNLVLFKDQGSRSRQSMRPKVLLNRLPALESSPAGANSE